MLTCFSLAGQQDTTGVTGLTSSDTSATRLNMDAVYARPFLTSGKWPVALGGYIEANSQFAQTDGVNDGLSFQFRRFTIFMSSTIAERLKFLSELEFEDGTREINIEFAAMDLEFHPMLKLRGGIFMNPIGAFNQNHDGPRWDFVDRPLSATTIIPSTLSNAGFGIHGKRLLRRWIFGYEAYITNGFNDRIISNEANRTSLAAGKSAPARFEESNSGLPMFTGKLAIRNRKVGELGFSYMNGVYNKWKSDGIILDARRSASVIAFDFNTSMLRDKLNLTGEWAQVLVDIPETYTQQFGSKQLGGYLDIVYTLLKRKLAGWENAKFNLGVRAEYVDYNIGVFRETGGKIGDERWALVPSLVFRPVGTTVLRFNYRYEQQWDLLGNPPASTAVFQFGFSTYF